MERVSERYGRLDGLFANAGAGIFKTVHDTGEEDFDELVTVNLKGVFFTVQKALPLLRRAGGRLGRAQRLVDHAPGHGARRRVRGHQGGRPQPRPLARRRPRP
ncbi:SDR family NAD(P)-dependent oxidoreductase [Streptomyces tremellae]|uniref:Uncharacterized protein n=1 Tax=Streptomyces tremellae TaxID=1124239 RepID=A0ABP7EU80_9ACTN